MWVVKRVRCWFGGHASDFFRIYDAVSVVA